jgi:hypothetical protein
MLIRPRKLSDWTIGSCGKYQPHCRRASPQQQPATRRQHGCERICTRLVVKQTVLSHTCGKTGATRSQSGQQLKAALRPHLPIDEDLQLMRSRV